MFWILRRTGAVNFFNSINNNHSSNNKITDKNNSRPPRKAYGRLSVESDDTNHYQKNLKYHTSNVDDDDDDDDDEANDIVNVVNIPAYQIQNETSTFKSITNTQNNCNNNHNNNNHPLIKHADSNLSKSNSNNNVVDELNLETGETTIEHHKRIIGNLNDDSNGCLNNHHSSCHSNCSNMNNGNSCREIRENMIRNGNIDDKTITRLQAMALHDEDEFDESLTCNVCDRAFHCHRQLASHQQKKRHFGCSGCDSLFPSLMLLEHHKEEFEHWSDVEDDDRRNYCCKRNRRMLDDDDFYDTDTATSDAESEDLERLL